MKRNARAAALIAATLTLAVSLTACGSSTSNSTSLKGQTITYWATNQAATLGDDKAILTPEIAKFTKETGIKVNLEVVPWGTLYNRILTATTSGVGPDVLNIGNTWSASLQATGAFVPWTAAQFAKVGGESRFVASGLSSSGAAGKPPVGLPIYLKPLELYYNKKMFAAAGITSAPTTWGQFVADAKKTTDPAAGQYGFSYRGASGQANQILWVLGSQLGAKFFNGNKSDFAQPALAQAMNQYLSWFGSDGIINPSDAESTDPTKTYTAFANNKDAMMIEPTMGTTLGQFKITTADYGVAKVPAQDNPPSGGKQVGSFVGGTNVTIFKNSKHLAAATAFVKFLTGAKEQVALNKAYGSLPAVKDATDPFFNTDEFKVATETLGNWAGPLPMVPGEGQYETLVGGVSVALAAQTVTGKQPSIADIEAQLAAADQKYSAGS